MSLGPVGEQDYSPPQGFIAFTMLNVLPALEKLNILKGHFHYIRLH